jgi:glycosyltransferase involved in cell wall biosynthesis
VAGRLPDTPYARNVRNQHAERNLGDTIRFLGYRSDGDALRSAADAMVLPSRSEGLPMVVLEAMMAGLPVVATRVGGVPEALSGGAGLTVESASPDPLADAMARVLCEPDLRAKLAGQARRKAQEQFSAEAMGARYLDAYAATLARRGKRGGRA